MAYWLGGNATLINLNKIITLQKRTIRLISNALYNGHTDPLYTNCGILLLCDLFKYQDMLYMYDYIHCKWPPSF